MLVDPLAMWQSMAETTIDGVLMSVAGETLWVIVALQPVSILLENPAKQLQASVVCLTPNRVV
jgi:hypothetical protein